MSHIYLISPSSSTLRPINKKKDKKTGKPLVYPKANNLDVKFGIHKSGGLSTLQTRYKYYIGDYTARLIVEGKYEDLLIFERHLKDNVFVKYINDFRSKTNNFNTKEWMTNISMFEAAKIIDNEYKKFSA